MGGFSIGFMAGVDCVSLCVVIMSRSMLGVLASTGSLNIGGELGVSAGPLGRTASLGVTVGRGAATAYTYSQSRGLFAGVDLNGSIIVTRKSVNHRFYGVHHDAREILMGDVAKPDAAMPLYEAIQSVTASPELTAQQNDAEPY